MDTIDAIIVKRQSAHKTSVLLTRQGEPWQLASEPQGGLANKHNKGIVRTLWVSQQYSSCDHNHHQKSVNRRDTGATNATKNQEVL